jgi:hypothetical protein
MAPCSTALASARANAVVRVLSTILAPTGVRVMMTQVMSAGVVLVGAVRAGSRIVRPVPTVLPAQRAGVARSNSVTIDLLAPGAQASGPVARVRWDRVPVAAGPLALVPEDRARSPVRATTTGGPPGAIATMPVGRLGETVATGRCVLPFRAAHPAEAAPGTARLGHRSRVAPVVGALMATARFVRRFGPARLPGATTMMTASDHLGAQDRLASFCTAATPCSKRSGRSATSVG